jgi:quercetin dioxygenase-like cupin family protein
VSDGYSIVSLEEVETLGFRPAGVGARTADAGGELIEPHTEDAGVEKLYVVVRGRATFTVDGEMADAPAGSFVFAPPEAHRAAVASEDGTTVFVVGGTIGEPFRA